MNDDPITTAYASVALSDPIYSGIDERTLLCPRCNSEHLHQGKVIVYDRSEDAEIIRRTTVDGDSVATETVPNATSGNPSDRRQGLSIEFRCEKCDDPFDAPFQLTISQHKGVTLIGWRALSLKKE
jgi:hypothetical protein